MKTLAIAIAIASLILNAIQFVLSKLLSPKERMKKRILKELNRLLNADKNNTFIPAGELGDILIQRINPIFRMRFCEIFLESIRELDEKEIIIIDRDKIPISLEIDKPIEYPPKYHSNHFTYGSLRKIDPDQYIGLNNAECRKHIESREASARWRYEQYENSY